MILLLGIVGSVLLTVFGLWWIYQQGFPWMFWMETNRVRNLISKHETELARTALKNQELERKRISEDLHDGVNSILMNVNINLHFALKETTSAEGRKFILESIKLTDEAMESIRHMAKNMTPSILESLGLSHAVEELCSRMKTDDQRVIFSTNEEINYSNEWALQVYRLIQEITNNYRKHSHGTVISIQLMWSEYLTICFTDNGKPFEYSFRNGSDGVGLFSINDRIKSLNASMNSEAGSPNTTWITAPIK